MFIYFVTFLIKKRLIIYKPKKITINNNIMDLRPIYFVMYAKFDSICNETGKTIKTGEVIVYTKPIKNVQGGKTYSKDSKMYKEAKNSVYTSWNINESDI